MDEVSLLLLETFVTPYFLYSSAVYGEFCLCALVQSVVALQRFTLLDFTHAHFGSEAHTLHLSHHPNAKSLTQNYLNKITVLESFKPRD
jgi:hypothetical protein